jgi:hypothetical protein
VQLKVRFGAAMAIASAAVVMAALPASATPAHLTVPRAGIQLPAYTIAISTNQMSLQVYKTSTGAPVATLKAPPGQPFEQVASAGTASTFLAAAGTNAMTQCGTWYYKFQLSPTGRPSKLTLVRKMPTGWLSTGVAASPGGGTFAYTAVHCDHPGYPEGVVGISGKAGTRTWTYGLSEDTPLSLAASADGDTLAFQGFIGPREDGLLLNTDSTSTTVIGASRVVIKSGSPGSMEISPDASTIYACMGNGAGGGDVASFSAATGKQLKVLRTFKNALECFLSADATGKLLLATIVISATTSDVIGLDPRTGASVTLRLHPALPVQQGSLVTW